MVNLAGFALVFVYYGERRAGNRFGCSQVFAQGFNERSFTRAHISVKKKNFIAAGVAYYCRGCRW